MQPQRRARGRPHNHPQVADRPSYVWRSMKQACLWAGLHNDRLARVTQAIAPSCHINHEVIVCSLMVAVGTHELDTQLG